MSHVIKMNCHENHQTPAFRGVDSGWRFRSGSCWGRQQRRGEVGLPAPGPPRPGPPPGAASSHPARSNSLSAFHVNITHEMPPPKRQQAPVDFPGKRPLQNLICDLFVSK